MKLLFVFALFPFAVMANPLETDFEKIFADNASSVIVKDGGKSVTLPGEIVVSQNAEGEILVLDGSSHNAVGCILRLTLQSVAVGRLCPESLTGEQSSMLDANITGFAKFYAENNIPKNELDSVTAAIEDSVVALTKRLANLQCDTAEVDRFKDFVGLLTNEETQSKLSESLAAPRLPAVNPCL